MAKNINISFDADKLKSYIKEKISEVVIDKINKLLVGRDFSVGFNSRNATWASDDAETEEEDPNTRWHVTGITGTISRANVNYNKQTKQYEVSANVTYSIRIAKGEPPQ